MKCLILASLLALASAQISGGSWEDFLASLRDRDRQQSGSLIIDHLHEYRVEEHITETDHLLFFIDDSREHRVCYFLKVGTSWEALLHDTQEVYRITEEIYEIINDPNHEQKEVSRDELSFVYGDAEAIRDCRGHETYLIRYTPTTTTA